MLTLRGLITAVLVITPFAGALFAISGRHAFLTAVPQPPASFADRDQPVDPVAVRVDAGPRGAMRLDREIVVMSVPTRPATVTSSRKVRHDSAKTGFSSGLPGTLATSEKAGSPGAEGANVEAAVQSSSGSRGLTAGP
jgi:hypothetical protein